MKEQQKQVLWSATLDMLTCPECADLDGKEGWIPCTTHSSSPTLSSSSAFGSYLLRSSTTLSRWPSEAEFDRQPLE